MFTLKHRFQGWSLINGLIYRTFMNTTWSGNLFFSPLLSLINSEFIPGRERKMGGIIKEEKIKRGGLRWWNLSVSPEHSLTWGPSPAEGCWAGRLWAWHCARLPVSWTPSQSGRAPVVWPLVLFAPLPKPCVRLAWGVVSPPLFPPERSPLPPDRSQSGRPWIPSLRYAALKGKTNVSCIAGILDQTRIHSKIGLLLLLQWNELIQSHIWPTSPWHRGVIYWKQKCISVSCYPT